MAVAWISNAPYHRYVCTLEVRDGHTNPAGNQEMVVPPEPTAPRELTVHPQRKEYCREHGQQPCRRAQVRTVVWNPRIGAAMPGKTAGIHRTGRSRRWGTVNDGENDDANAVSCR